MSVILSIPPNGAFKFINVTESQRRADLLKVLDRGLNTWSPPIPQWLLDLQRELTNERK